MFSALTTAQRSLLHSGTLEAKGQKSTLRKLDTCTKRTAADEAAETDIGTPFKETSFSAHATVIRSIFTMAIGETIADK